MHSIAPLQSPFLSLILSRADRIFVLPLIKMASPPNEIGSSPPSNPWQDTDTDMTESDDVDFEVRLPKGRCTSQASVAQADVPAVQLATESGYSELSTDGDGEEEETTIYFDAEEGRLEMPDGTTLEVVSDDEEEIEEDEQGGEEGEEGSRTPQAAASTAQTATGVQRDPQTITSTSPTVATPTQALRPSLVRRASSAMQRRVSRAFFCAHADSCSFAAVQ